MAFSKNIFAQTTTSAQVPLSAGGDWALSTGASGRGTIRHALTVAKEAHIDICIKDVETIRHRPQDLVAWFALVREIIDECA